MEWLEGDRNCFVDAHISCILAIILLSADGAETIKTRHYS